MSRISRIDSLPESIWNAVHAQSKTKGQSEGAISMRGGQVDLVFGGVHFKIHVVKGFSAKRLSEFTHKKLQEISESRTWHPVFVVGKAKRSRTVQRSCPKSAEHACDATCDFGDLHCERCNDTKRITVDKGDSEDCPECA